MIDTGLLLSAIVGWAVLSLAARWASPGSSVLDRMFVPMLGGLVAGRLTAVALDDPSSLGSLRDLMIIRSGVEFWPGVAAFTVLAIVVLRRARTPIIAGLAEIAPFALWAYALYEATCAIRGTCYGPASLFGLVPDGLAQRQLPIGLVVGLAVAALAWVIRELAATPAAKVLIAVGGVALIRSVAAIWLPRLNGSITRPHRESIAILASTVVLGSIWWGRAAWSARRAGLVTSTHRPPR